MKRLDDHCYKERIVYTRCGTEFEVCVCEADRRVCDDCLAYLAGRRLWSVIKQNKCKRSE